MNTQFENPSKASSHRSRKAWSTPTITVARMANAEGQDIGMTFDGLHSADSSTGDLYS